MSTGRKIIGAFALAMVVLLIAAGITLHVINAKNGSWNPGATATSSAPTAAASSSSTESEQPRSAFPSYQSETPEVAASPSSTAVEAPEPSATIPQPSAAPASAPPAEHAPTATPTSPAAHPTPSGSRNTDLVVPPGPNGTPEWKQLNITTPNEAIALVSRVEFRNNPDFTYAGFPNQDGSFEVVVRSRSLQKGGGSGTVGKYRVTRDGNFTLIS